MAYIDPTTPNLADFTTFVYNQGITSAQLPSTSEYLQDALTNAQDVALFVPAMPSTLYVNAVYNYGFHSLLKVAQDQVGYTTFQDLRTKYKMLDFLGGVIAGSSDESTSQTIAVSESLKNLTLSALDLIKTPWGRYYLEYAQQYGPNICGIS